ncbi:MAG: M20/M25/M40 family metallo-hydrolase, partial [Rhizobiales bacterium]|nr:M20/M25/M40 family metallo-hydrolase [Hyphomicrobiales bacterium]
VARRCLCQPAGPDPVLQQTQPNIKDYVLDTDYGTMDYSASGDVTAVLQNAGGIVIPPNPAPPPNSASGCDPADFTGFVPGNIALIQRGTCSFAQKVENATAAGASAAIVFNEGNPGRTDNFGGTLGAPVTIPVLSASFAVGEELAALASPTVRVKTETLSEIRNTVNLLAEKRHHRHSNSNRVVVVGAHLDSVFEGPGIHDNGSGSAALLEIALQMQRGGFRTRNAVRFAWWGAEESGLLGSEHYVTNLSDEERAKIFANLNFDMIGSPNAVRFVYDGDGSDTPDAGPAGSDVIEDVFLDYFAAKGLANKPTAFDGRSDYGPFIDVGIPAGGLFTGAEGLKTAEEAVIFGGEAGIAYDICYHQACDDINNVGSLGLKTLREMSDATAHAIITIGNRRDPLVPPAARARVSRVELDNLPYRGGHLQR